MATPPRINSESVANQPLINGKSAKPLKGKYDGRGKYKRLAHHKAAIRNSARKPKWLTHLGTETFNRLIQDYDSIASWPQIYAEAWAKRQLNLVIQMREYADSRLLGKPFVAENPNATKPAGNILNDNRLQIAIQQLVPAKKHKKLAQKQAKSNVLNDSVSSDGTHQASSEAKQLTQGDAQAQPYVDSAAQVVDSNQDGSK